MDATLQSALAIAIAVVLCIVAYKKQLMTPWATLVAFVLAGSSGIICGLEWEIVFILFPLFGFAATLFRFDEKKQKGLQEGKHGERKLLNILGVSIVPFAIVIVSSITSGENFQLAIAFMSAFAVSTSDTLASELGIRDSKVYMITNGRPCEPGTNGGVSRYGLAVSSVGSIVFGVIAYCIMFQEFSVWMLVPGIAGIIGNLMDSVEGALLENKGYMSKYTVNASTSLIGAVIGSLIAAFA